MKKESHPVKGNLFKCLDKKGHSYPVINLKHLQELPFYTIRISFFLCINLS